MISIYRCLAVLIVVNVLPVFVVFAQEPEDPANGSGQSINGWKGSISVNYLTIDSKVATNEGIGRNGFGVDLIGSYYFSSQVVANLSFGILNFNDESEFQQQVIATNGFGSSDVETVDSSAGAFPFTAEVNYQNSNLSGSKAGFRIGAGYSQLLSAKREIDNCTDCREEDLNIDGGAYVKGSLFYTTLSTSKFGLAAKQYLSGDLSNGISLWYEYSR